jgi:hypothetical protein
VTPRLLLAVTLLAVCPGCLVVQVTATNPIPGLSTVAVAPFVNLSAERAVDGRRVALAYYAELQKTPGFQVVPVGVVEVAIVQNRLDLQNPDDVLKLAQILDVDAVVIGAVTDYSPYYPPRIGLNVDWYAPRGIAFHPGPPVDPLARDRLRNQLDEIQDETRGKYRDPPWAHQVPRSSRHGDRCPPEADSGGSARASACDPFGTTPSGSVPALEAVPPHDAGAMPGAPPLVLPAPALPDDPSRAMPVRPGPGAPPRPTDAALRTDVRGQSPEAAGPDGPPPPPAPTGSTPANGPHPTPPLLGPPGASGPPGPTTGPAFSAPFGPFVPPAPFESDPRRPIMSYTRLFDATDADLTATLRDYVELNGDLRSGGWKAYLDRSEDFLRFAAHRMITEMLVLHGGEGKRRYVWTLRKLR